MIFAIYKKAIAVLAKKPFKLWGISLLSILLCALATALFGIIPGLALAITTLISTAMVDVFYRGYRGEEVEVLNLCACMKDWTIIKRILCGLFWRFLWVFIWGLIPVAGPIFAIIRSYEWRFVPYLMLYNPEVQPKDALKVSKEMTMGYKAKMFWGDVLPGVLISVALSILAALGTIKYVGWLFIIIFVVVLLVVVLFYSLFMGLVDAAWYDEIKNGTIETLKPVKKEKPAPAPAPAPAINANTAFCPNCGAKVAADAAFCPGCGNKLK